MGAIRDREPFLPKLNPLAVGVVVFGVLFTTSVSVAQETGACRDCAKLHDRQATTVPMQIMGAGRLAASGGFLPPMSFAAGTNPQFVAIGDFNRDGKLDLAVADNIFSPNPGFMSVLLGNGDGTYQTPVAYGPFSNPVSIAVGDFNGDGKLDLAVADDIPGNGTVSVLLGNGDGTFGAAEAYGAGSLPNSVVVGDFNGDGTPDLAAVNYGSDSVSVLLGRGDGTFQPAQSYSVGSRPISLTVADLNRDGKQDLVVVNFSDNTVSVLLGNGDGTFRTSINYYVGSEPISVAVGDFNGDDNLDLAVANQIFGNGTVSVLLGTGDGTFGPAVGYGAGSSPSSVTTGDFNGDGKLDLVAANSNGDNVSVLLGKSDGSFQPAANYGAGSSPASVAVGDFNRDGALDLVVANFSRGTASILLNIGGGGLPVVSLSPASLDFGSEGLCPITPLTVTLTNTGDAALNISTVTITGANPGDFNQTNTCLAPVLPRKSCAVRVVFVPLASGMRSAAITINDSTLDSPQLVPLTGVGVSGKPKLE